MIFPASWGFPASHLWPGGLLLDIIQLFDLILVAHSQHWPCEEVVVDLQRRNMVQRSQLTASIYSYIYIYILCASVYALSKSICLYIYIIHMYTYTNIQYTCVHWIHETYIIALPSHLTWFALTKALKSWNFSTQTNDEIINSRRTSIIIRLTCCCEMAWSGVKCCDVCQYCQCKKKMHQSFIILSLSLSSLSLSLSLSPSLHRHPESSATAEMNDSSCTILLISISSAVEISSHPNNTPAPWSGSKIQDPGWAHAAPEDDEPGGDIYR